MHEHVSVVPNNCWFGPTLKNMGSNLPDAFLYKGRHKAGGHQPYLPLGCLMALLQYKRLWQQHPGHSSKGYEQQEDLHKERRTRDRYKNRGCLHLGLTAPDWTVPSCFMVSSLTAGDHYFVTSGWCQIPGTDLA